MCKRSYVWTRFTVPMVVAIFVRCESFAFVSPATTSPMSRVTSFPSSSMRSNSRLYDSSGGDNNDKESEQPVNDLDIFGQPKDKPRNKNEDEGEIRGPDRIKSCIPYTLVLIDGDSFGRYIYERIPPLGSLDYVFLRPIVDAVHIAPLLGVLLFVVFALGPQFTNQSREVRFNSQQAVLIDVALIFPQLIGEAIADEKIPRALLEPCTNFVWYAYVSLVIYCVTSNLRGKIPNQIPFVSAAADMAIGPF